ncbi:MAG TPA: hypothetical protein VJY62_02435 [Bacteroidia bacterium]|nr:hypothetical protein [Bacteroidia bacterium]
MKSKLIVHRITALLLAIIGGGLIANAIGLNPFILMLIFFALSFIRMPAGLAFETTFTFTPNTYAGELLAGYQATALLSPGLVERGLITVIPNVKKRKLMRSLDDDFAFQTPSAVFTPQTSSITIPERYLDPVAYEIHKQYNYSTLVTSWEAQQLKPGEMQDYDGTVELSDFLVQRALKKIAIQNEQLYLLGKSANALFTFSSSYTGLLPLMLADSNVRKLNPGANATFAVSDITKATEAVVTVVSTTNLEVGDYVTVLGVAGTGNMSTQLNGNSYLITGILSGTTLSIGVDTSAATGTPTFGSAKLISINRFNVISVFSTIYNTIPDALRAETDLKIYIPLHVERAYKLSQAAGTNVVGAFVGDKVLDFLGNVLTPMPYWKPNVIVIAKVSNMFLAVDLLGDGSSLETVDMRKTTLDQVVRMKCGMKSDVNYMFSQEIEMWRPA